MAIISEKLKETKQKFLLQTRYKLGSKRYFITSLIQFYHIYNLVIITKH